MGNNLIKLKRIIIFIIILSLFCLFLSCDDDTCYVCAGTGFTKLDACSVCKGTGKCFNCQGTGKIPKYNIN